MNNFIQIILTTFLLSSASVYGQNQVPMADQLRSEGKIYVVVAIILIILSGLIFYLFLMDKKIKKLEKLVSDKKGQTN